MNNILGNLALNNLSLQNLPLFNTNVDSLGMPPTYQGMASFVANLQNVIIKQQSIINALIAQTQNQEKSLETMPLKTEHPPVKTEAELTPTSQQENEPSSIDSTSEITEESLKESQEIVKKEPKIRRRNGFKTKATKVSVKVEDIEEDDSVSTKEGSPTKSSLELKLKNSSKAKHLWVNYGRRILEYAINQTKGPMQNKIKQLVGKLNSKKDFEKTFQIVSSDSGDDKLFKTLLGRLAIYFVKHKASPTFESSKYKQEMITQRHTVAAWIERLISA